MWRMSDARITCCCEKAAGRVGGWERRVRPERRVSGGTRER
jgi:hypothetical protein